MAVGDITWFRAGLLALGTKLINLNADSIKLGLIRGAAGGGIDPTNVLADPRWGAGGTTNLSTSQVTTGTSYANGGPTLANKTFALQANVPTMRADIVTIAQDASGFTNARWGILYETVTLRALAYVDLGTDRSVVGGELKIDWSGVENDILTIS